MNLRLVSLLAMAALLRAQVTVDHVPMVQRPVIQDPAAQYPLGQYPVDQYPAGQPPAAQNPTVQDPQPPAAAAPGDGAAAPAAQMPAAALTPRVRDVTRLHNVMPHLLVGAGLVTGLAGTGSTDRATRQAILNFVRDQNLNVAIADVVGGNTALVSMTASLPPFSKEGATIDVKVQVLGDATSLRGGELLRAVLYGVDHVEYAVAQGPILVGGFAAQGTNASVQKNLSTTGWLTRGGLVVREMH